MLGARKPGRLRRLAFTPGKGSSFVAGALAAECDIYVTGETGYHAAQVGASAGMRVIELGHRESELYFLKTLKRWLSKRGWDAVVMNRPTQEIV